ncbi:MAG: nucleotidyltransferase domain-containing protein [Clostridiales bacterium]|nr:nucleotidyltransferase domain-containing protein [Clostridiales bacterium]
MVADVEATRRIAKRYAADVKRALPVDKAILFGSYAKGTSNVGSDIDLCFFLRDFGGKRRVDIMMNLLDLTDGYRGVFFEPIAFQTSEIERGNPFVKQILATGIEI